MISKRLEHGLYLTSSILFCALIIGVLGLLGAFCIVALLFVVVFIEYCISKNSMLTYGMMCIVSICIILAYILFW